MVFVSWRCGRLFLVTIYLVCFLSATCNASNGVNTVALEQSKYSVIEGNVLEICLEVLSGNFSMEDNVTLVIDSKFLYFISRCYSIHVVMVSNMGTPYTNSSSNGAPHHAVVHTKFMPMQALFS